MALISVHNFLKILEILNKDFDQNVIGKGSGRPVLEKLI